MPDIYLWIEDRKGKAGCLFWESFMKQLYPEVIVESKKNNSELVKAVRELRDEKNKYIIVFDNSFDNVQVSLEQKRLKTLVDVKNNVYMMNIICFEYVLLEFDKLIDWIFAEDDEFLTKRTLAIRAREKLIEAVSSREQNYKAIQEVLDYDKHISNHNIEQLSAKLLFELTKNTGFEVSKGRIGDCWIRSCCDWPERQENDCCGLDNSRLSITDKMRSIYTGTSLCAELGSVGLGAPL